jgi:hypothetical protein
MIRSTVVVCIALASAGVHAAETRPAVQCTGTGNDDTVRPYDPSLRAGLLKAYAHLFPQARMPPDEQAFQAGAHIRCMDGRLLACFTGANLPCSKMDTSSGNKGADAFCRSDPTAQFVPAFAVGHDSAYAYRCISGRAEIVGETLPLDASGFAVPLWTPID